MFTDSNGWTYNVGNIDGRAQPALYRTKTGEPLEILGYFKDKDMMWVFVEALSDDPTLTGPITTKRSSLPDNG